MKQAEIRHLFPSFPANGRKPAKVVLQKLTVISYKAMRYRALSVF